MFHYLDCYLINMKVYVGGLRSDCDKDEVREAFADFGRVRSFIFFIL